MRARDKADVTNPDEQNVLNFAARQDGRKSHDYRIDDRSKTIFDVRSGAPPVNFVRKKWQKREFRKRTLIGS